MARGVVSGLVWGGILGAGGLIAASENLPRVEMLAFAPPEAVEVVSPSAPDAPPQPDAQSAVPQAVSVPEVAVPGAPPAPAAPTETAMPEATPAPMPAATPTPKAEPAPEMVAEATAPSAEEPVMAQPEAQAPVASASDAAPAVVVAPSPVVAQPAQNAAPDVSAAPEVVARAETEEPATPPVAAPEVAEVPADTPMVDDAPSAPADTMPAEPAAKTPLPQVDTADAGVAPRVSSMPTGVGAPRPSVMTKPEAIGTQAGPIQSAAPVTTGRLPTVGSTPDVAAEAPKDALPIEMNAVPFDNPDNLPVLSVVLIDDGQFALSDADLAALPFPVSIGIPATRADAAKAAERYRSAGQEVLVIAALPTGAAPTDAAVTIEAALQSVPQAVAVMDTPGAAFQTDRATAAQVVATAGQGGLGLVTYARGLNAIEQEAARENVQAGVVFRVFDGEGRSVLAMQRYLDQAAFRAAQAPGVILVGTLKKDTLQALAEWRLGSRAATVALAPVTAALTAE